MAAVVADSTAAAVASTAVAAVSTPWVVAASTPWVERRAWAEADSIRGAASTRRPLMVAVA
jgi:hypothetical protein